MKVTLLLLAAICLGLFSLSSCKSDRYKRGYNETDSNEFYQNQENTFESKNLPVYSKRNLQSLLLGKNKIEVEEIMGPPEGKSLDGGNGYLWDYRRSIFDDSTEKVYEWSLVSFKFLGGLCSEVRIRLEDPPTFQLSNDLNGSF
jgi:hypothetical protein